MAEKDAFYRVNQYGDDLQPGDRIKFEHSLYYQGNGTHLSPLTALPADKLAAMREESVAQEKALYEKLRGALTEWEEQGANTMLLDKAIEYVKTPPVKHTSNEWQVTDYGGFECSNMVYKMTYQIRKETKRNYTTKKDEVVAWLVSWDVRYNFPPHASGGGHIAGQERKKFTEKEKLDNYVIGRITAHAQYFEEVSPPVPKNLAWKFSRNGQLMPGYTVEGQAPPVPAKDEPAPDKAAIPAKENGAPAKVGSGDNTIDYSKFIRKNPKKGSRAAKGGNAR